VGFGEDLLAVVLHVGDDGTGCSGLLVLCAPDEKIEKDRGQIDALFSEAVVDAAGVVCVGLGGKDAGGFEGAETVGEDVGCDAFAGCLELLEGAVGPDHEVADDEQRPAVSEYLERDADGTAGSAFAFHGGKVAIFTCRMQVICDEGMGSLEPGLKSPALPQKQQQSYDNGKQQQQKQQQPQVLRLRNSRSARVTSLRMTNKKDNGKDNSRSPSGMTNKKGNGKSNCNGNYNSSELGEDHADAAYDVVGW
jgi:hypothetical protein